VYDRSRCRSIGRSEFRLRWIDAESYIQLRLLSPYIKPFVRDERFIFPSHRFFILFRDVERPRSISSLKRHSSGIHKSICIGSAMMRRVGGRRLAAARKKRKTSSPRCRRVTDDGKWRRDGGEGPVKSAIIRPPRSSVLSVTNFFHARNRTSRGRD